MILISGLSISFEISGQKLKLETLCIKCWKIPYVELISFRNRVTMVCILYLRNFPTFLWVLQDQVDIPSPYYLNRHLSSIWNGIKLLSSVLSSGVDVTWRCHLDYHLKFFSYDVFIWVVIWCFIWDDTSPFYLFIENFIH
jgi:hypothetical protein